MDSIKSDLVTAVHVATPEHDVADAPEIVSALPATEIDVAHASLQEAQTRPEFKQPAIAAMFEPLATSKKTGKNLYAPIVGIVVLGMCAAGGGTYWWYKAKRPAVPVVATISIIAPPKCCCRIGIFCSCG